MHMGIVANPVPEHNFDGKIALTHVSKTRKCKRSQHIQIFSDDNDINDSAKEGWWNIAAGDMAAAQILVTLVEHFDLDDGVTENIAIRCKSGSAWKEVDASGAKLSETRVGHDGPFLSLDMNNDKLWLEVFWKKGTEHEADITCGSDFVAKQVPKIGKKSACGKHCWVPHKGS